KFMVNTPFSFSPHSQTHSSFDLQVGPAEVGHWYTLSSLPRQLPPLQAAESSTPKGTSSPPSSVKSIPSPIHVAASAMDGETASVATTSTDRRKTLFQRPLMTPPYSISFRGCSFTQVFTAYTEPFFSLRHIQV